VLAAEAHCYDGAECRWLDGDRTRQSDQYRVLERSPGGEGHCEAEAALGQITKHLLYANAKSNYPGEKWPDGTDCNERHREILLLGKRLNNLQELQNMRGIIVPFAIPAPATAGQKCKMTNPVMAMFQGQLNPGAVANDVTAVP
jgi:hypothetical protein